MSLFDVPSEEKDADYGAASDYYLSCVEGWSDPNPKPVIEIHEGIYVVRDDLLQFGSKIRFIDHLIQSNPQIDEWCFGGAPAQGYAQISLGNVCAKYGKKAVMFMAARSMDNLHPYQKKGMEVGTVYHWVPNGMLPVTLKRARDYVAESPETRRCFPLGLEDDTVLGSIIKVAQDLWPEGPQEFWSVGSSGTLNRGLQMAWPKALANVVSVGHTMKDREIGRAKHFRSPYKFGQDVKGKDIPPFPSASSYDAKGWSVMLNALKENNNYPPKAQILYWNVA